MEKSKSQLQNELDIINKLEKEREKLLTNITLVEVKNAMENHNKVLEKLLVKIDK